VRTRSSTPTYWAITQARLGEALLLKAEATEDALYARQSLTALDKAVTQFGDDSQNATAIEARRHRIAARRLLEEIKAACEMAANDAP